MMIANSVAPPIREASINGRLALGDDADIFTRIYDPKINLAIWKRPSNPTLTSAAQNLLNAANSIQLRTTLPVERVGNYLSDSLPLFEHRQDLIDDISLISDMFACLFGLEHIGLRLASLDTAMCPKFHVDRVPCRLLSSYCGVGTEWLADEHVDRSKLGRGSMGLSDADSGLYSQAKAIQQFKTGEVGLLKGELWEGNEDAGLVHRSPPVEKEQARLLLSLDFA